jgi:hypothetical protein
MKHPHIDFVVGYPRSGTTLLISQLQRHFSIGSAPETHLYTYNFAPLFTRSWKLRTLKATSTADWLIQNNFRLEDFDLAQVDFTTTSSALSKRAHLVTRVLAAAAPAEEHIIEKTPQHGRYLDQIARDFPKSKIIYIERNPFDTVSSCIDAMWTHSNPVRHTIEWLLQRRQAERFRRSNPERIEFVSFEELLSNPTGELQRLSKALGLKQRAAREQVELSTIPTWESDWKEKSGAEVDAAKKEQWTARYSETHHTVALVLAALGEPSYLEGFKKQHKGALEKLSSTSPVSIPRIRRLYYKFAARQIVIKYLLGHWQGRGNRDRRK